MHLARPCALFLVIALLTSSLVFAKEKPSYARSFSKAVTKVGKSKIKDVFETFQLIIEDEETYSPVEIALFERKHESLSLVATERLPSVRQNGVLASKVIFTDIEIPGRTIEVSVECECLIDVRFNIGRVKLQGVFRDNKPTVVVLLPEPEFHARFPGGKVAKFKVDYGILRSKWLDSDDAIVFRQGLYKKLIDAAEMQYRTQHFDTLRQTVQHDVQSALQSVVPEVEVVVEFQEQDNITQVIEVSE